MFHSLRIVWRDIITQRFSPYFTTQRTLFSGMDLEISRLQVIAATGHRATQATIGDARDNGDDW